MNDLIRETEYFSVFYLVGAPWWGKYIRSFLCARFEIYRMEVISENFPILKSESTRSGLRVTMSLRLWIQKKKLWTGLAFTKTA